MPEPILSPGARHRQAVRAVFGRPGSLTRWLISTAVWLAFCGLLATRVEYLVRIIILVFALVVPFATFKARELMVGDEDELRAHLRRDARAPRPTLPEEDRLPPEAWLSRGGKLFDDAPPAPVAEDDLGGPVHGDSSEHDPSVPLG